MVVIATHVIKRHNASINDIHRFSRISAKREQVEVLCVTRPLRWTSGSAWGWLRQTSFWSGFFLTIMRAGVSYYLLYHVKNVYFLATKSSQVQALLGFRFEAVQLNSCIINVIMALERVPIFQCGRLTRNMTLGIDI